MFGPEERQCAVDLCFTTPPATAQVVRRLGYPTRQCLERWLAKGSGYAGRMAKPIIPLKTRTRAIELVLGGIRREQATERLSAGVGAVHNWVTAYQRGRHGRVATRERECQPGRQARTATESRHRRRRGASSAGRGAGIGERVDVGGGGGRRKRPGADLRRLSDRERTLAAGHLRPACSPGLMTCLPAYRAERPPTTATPGSALANTPGCVSGWPRCSPPPRTGTGTVASRPRS